MIDTCVIPLLKILFVLNATLIGVTYMVLLERKVIAWVQVRLGPMRVGPYGILQPIADAIKLILKEDITPTRADKWVFTAAPIIVMVPALITFAVIPFGPSVNLFGRDIPLYITDINVGLLYIVSVASIGVYGIILGRLGVEQQVSAAREPARVGAAHQLRSRGHHDAREPHHDGGLAQHGEDRRGAVHLEPVVHLRAAGGVRPVLHRRPGRDQPRAVRHGRSRAGADRRLSHRVQRHAVRAVLPGRIREHDRRLGRGDHAVSRRMAGAVSERRMR